MKAILTIFVILIGAQFPAYSQSRPSNTDLKILSNVEAIMAGKPMPDIRLPDDQGDTIKLSDFKGYNLYLNFWATWCKPCLEHMDFYKSLSKEYEGKKVKFVFISIDKDTAAAKRYIVREKIPGVNLLAGGFKTPPVSFFVIRAQWKNDELTDYEQGIPRYFMINKKGIIVHNDLQKVSDAEIRQIIKNQVMKD